MAFDENSSVPSDQRLVSTGRAVEDPRAVTPVLVATTTSRPAGEGGFHTNSPFEVGKGPQSIPVFYPAAGIGFGNAVPSPWYASHGAVGQMGHMSVNPAIGHHGAVGPIGQISVNPAIGLGFSPNLVPAVGVNTVDQMGNSEVATKFGVCPNLGTRNFGNLVSNESAGSSLGVNPNLITRISGGGTDQMVNKNAGGIGFDDSSEIRVNGCGSEHLDGESGSGHGPKSNSLKPVNAGGTDRVSDEGWEDSVSGKKVKFLCSFGGKIMPRPSDGMLRYVGGQTRIISVKKDVSFNELVQKMVETYGQSVVIKYQLPDEDLDALVSVSCPEDLDNMMDEYDKLLERSLDGSAKLRVFLFSASELDHSGHVQLRDLHDSGQRYMEAVNGIMDGIGGGITRKESISSAMSTQNSDISGSNEVVDSSVLGQTGLSRPPSTSNVTAKETPSLSKDASLSLLVDHNLPVHSGTKAASNFGIPALQASVSQVQSSHMEVEHEKPVPLSGPQAVSYGMQAYMDPTKESVAHALFVSPSPLTGYTDSPVLGNTGPIYAQRQFPDGLGSINPQHYVSPVHMTLGPGASRAGIGQPFIQQHLIHHSQQGQFEYNGSSTGQKVVFLPVEPTQGAYHHQVVVPPVAGGGGYGWHPIYPSGQGVTADGSTPNSQQEKLQILEDCYMYHNALPHVHSDTLIHGQGDNMPGSGGGPNPALLYHSLPVEDNIISTLSMSKPTTSGGSRESVVEPATGIQSSVAPYMESPCHYGALMGSIPHTFPENSISQHIANKSINVEASPVGNTFVHGFEQQFQGLPVDYSKLLDAQLENLHISAPEMNQSNNKNDWLLINDHPMTEILKPIQQQQHSARAEMPLDSSEVPFLHELQSGEPSKAYKPSELGIPQSHSQSKLGVQEESQGVFNGNFVVSTERIPSSAASPWMDEDVMLQPMTAPSDAELISSNVNGQSFSPQLIQTEDLQDSSNSFFIDQDPFSMQSDAPFPPPKPMRIALRKEALGTKVPFAESTSAKVGEFNSDDIHLANNLDLEKFQCLRDETIKQELQDVAEGVAASVLQSATSSELGLPGNEGTLEALPVEQIGNVDLEPQSEGNHEDTEADLPEKMNFGFPVSDGIGCLQIIKNSDLEELRELGSGTYGTVYHGKWRGSDVAIKRINDRCFTGKASEQERMRYDFWNEAIKLADLHHPNVVAFYGVVLDGPGGSVATVTEYMVNGSLRTALQKSERNLDKRKRLLIAMDVAFGMEYLHGKNIVHFDLKSDNLLVNLRDPHRPICKVGDLGLSKVKCQTLISGGVRGTLPWMAPELLNGSSSLVSEKVDVFSFGIVMWELLTGEEPYADLHYGAIIGGIVSNTLRPPVPETCDSEWKSLMERCWSSEPSERPSFTEIANQLRSMSTRAPSKPQNIH
ncbi:hypothetical protein SAY87_018878 [Trapa incisa]|uniref:Protein kinase domain-containing protein n=1 Tax=Trapa incisa TaxID=236973 RepID=A0AAN7Q0U1_9MYRT|nr:hypothetical protein SAY87_018878 [Trapa incisa]